jgi:hypothetical protein
VVHLIPNVPSQLLVRLAPQRLVSVHAQLLRRANDSVRDDDRHFSDALDVGVQEVSCALFRGEGFGESLGGGVDHVLGDLEDLLGQEERGRERQRTHSRDLGQDGAESDSREDVLRGMSRQSLPQEECTILLTILLPCPGSIILS